MISDRTITCIDDETLKSIVNAGDMWWGDPGIQSMAAELLQLRTENERLKAPQKVLQADEVTEPGWYWWRSTPLTAWQARKVNQIWDHDKDKSSMVLGGNCEGYMAMPYGEFIGPIPYPETDHADVYS